MVLPAPPAHAPSVEPHWFDKIAVAIELSAHGVLTLVDHAAPSRLREAYLRLRTHDPATDLIVDVQRLAELPHRTTVILAVTASVSADAVDWLNLNRPLVADRRLNIVLWCEGDAAAVLARGAPDFFDWISARVDCPPAPAAFAVADVKAAIRARAPGIAWAGPGMEETLAAVRPGRPIRRVAVTSYQSMIDALTPREPGWLFLEGIDTEFHLRRLRWAMAETGRRVLVLRRAIDQSLPNWWTVQAAHAPIAEAVHALMAAGGSSRLAALAGLDPAAIASGIFLLNEGIETARIEAQFAAAVDPRASLLDLARPLGWTSMAEITDRSASWISSLVQHAAKNNAASDKHDDEPVVSELRGQPLDSEQWLKLGVAALEADDFEVAIRWQTAALHSLPSDASPLDLALSLMHRGEAYQRAGNLTSARTDLERASRLAREGNDALLITTSATMLSEALLDQGEPQPARECLESALSVAAKLGDKEVADMLTRLASAMMEQDDLTGALQHLEQALSIRRKIFATEDHPSIAASLAALGATLAGQGDLEGARRHLERSIEINDRLGTPNPLMMVSTLELLAHIRVTTGDVLGARTDLTRALAIQRVTLGPDHPRTAILLLKLARTQAATGELDLAHTSLAHALAIQHKAFGDDGQLAGSRTRRELANVFAAQGNLTGAIENLQHALATQRRILERDDHPDVVATQRELERLQALQRDLQHPD